MGFAAWVHGAETAETAVTETAVRESRRAAAAVWRLSPEDWTRYEALMRGRRGVWTPGADPLLVLGAHARSEAERRRFAEAFVRAEHERVEGELAFERAVQAAWVRLFPGEPRLAAQSPVETPPERYALVFDRDCAGCAATVRAYAGGAVPVDLYVRGAGGRRSASPLGLEPRGAGGGRARRPGHREPRRRVRARSRARGVGAPGRAVGAGRMRAHGRMVFPFGLAAALATGVGAGGEGLIVVHDAGGTVPAARLRGAARRSTEERVAEALQRARGRLAGRRATARRRAA